MTTCDSVIVHYGPLEPTLHVALAALAWSGKVMVVANDLSPRPVECPKQVEWVVPSRNRGFGEAINLACSQSKSDVLLALNNDIVLKVGDVQRCLDEFQDLAVAVVAPVLRFGDGTVQSAAGGFSRTLHLPVMDLADPLEPRDCLWVTGAVMALRRTTLRDIRMDGGFFLGCEDVDFCLRVVASGSRVRLVPSSGVIHHGSVVISGPRWHYYVTRNPIWLAKKHQSTARWLLTIAFHSAMTCRVATADVVKRRGTDRTRSRLQGLMDSLRPKPESPWQDEPRPSRWLTW